MLNEDIILKNFDDFKKRLELYIGVEETSRLFEILGGEEKIMNAPRQIIFLTSLFGKTAKQKKIYQATVRFWIAFLLKN